MLRLYSEVLKVLGDLGGLGVLRHCMGVGLEKFAKKK